MAAWELLGRSSSHSTHHQDSQTVCQLKSKFLDESFIGPAGVRCPLVDMVGVGLDSRHGNIGSWADDVDVTSELLKRGFDFFGLPAFIIYKSSTIFFLLFLRRSKIFPLVRYYKFNYTFFFHISWNWTGMLCNFKKCMAKQLLIGICMDFVFLFSTLTQELS